MGGRTLANVCFHGIGEPRRELEPGEDQYWIGNGKYLAILDELATWPDVHISFDDGNASDADLGLPGLIDRGLSATFFALAGRVGSRGSLDTDQLRALAASGMVVGTHGMDHRPWRGLDEAARQRELVDAREQLAAIVDVPIERAALPLGRYDRAVLGHLRRLGYTRVYSSDRRSARADQWLQPRFSVRCNDTVESLRSAVLAPPGPIARVRGEAAGLVKRLR